MENILKRISRRHNVALPTGDNWHVELFNYFCEPAFQGLPVIFNIEQKMSLANYRRFRHVIRHGYSMQLDWDRMAEGVCRAAAVYAAFKTRLHDLFGI